MLVDEEILAKARRYQRNALEALLASAYPAVSRMALGLSGRTDVGRGITRFVMKQAVARVPRFRDADAAGRWFHHHTVLVARRAVRHAPSPQEDVLTAVGQPPPYTAFIRALRSLPLQQREAFILYHGEELDLRNLAIAMDCSTRAAGLHLQAAEQALRPMAQDDYEVRVREMRAAYAKLVPEEDALLPTVRSVVGRSLLSRRIGRLVKLIALVLILAAAAYAAWRFRAFLPWRPEDWRL